MVALSAVEVGISTYDFTAEDVPKKKMMGRSIRNDDLEDFIVDNGAGMKQTPSN